MTYGHCGWEHGENELQWLQNNSLVTFKLYITTRGERFEQAEINVVFSKEGMSPGIAAPELP